MLKASPEQLRHRTQEEMEADRVVARSLRAAVANLSDTTKLQNGFYDLTKEEKPTTDPTVIPPVPPPPVPSASAFHKNGRPKRTELAIAETAADPFESPVLMPDVKRTRFEERIEA